MRRPHLLGIGTHVPLNSPPGLKSFRSNHFAQDSEDYIQRINRLSDDELIYIVEMIQKGEESMGCLPVEDVEAFVHLVHDRLSPEMAQKVITVYEGGGECQH